VTEGIRHKEEKHFAYSLGDFESIPQKSRMFPRNNRVTNVEM
jgi:hypothetical protein